MQDHSLHCERNEVDGRIHCVRNEVDGGRGGEGMIEVKLLFMDCGSHELYS